MHNIITTFFSCVKYFISSGFSITGLDMSQFLLSFIIWTTSEAVSPDIEPSSIDLLLLHTGWLLDDVEVEATASSDDAVYM